MAQAGRALPQLLLIRQLRVVSIVLLSVAVLLGAVIASQVVFTSASDFSVSPLASFVPLQAEKISTIEKMLLERQAEERAGLTLPARVYFEPASTP